jgi:hypothetical protein
MGYGRGIKKLILFLSLCLFSTVSWSASYEVTGADGQIYDIEGPEGASDQEIIAAVQRQIAEEKRLQGAKKSSECAEYAEEAATEWAYRIIRRTCFESENTLFNKSKEFKCALDAGEAKIERAARDIYHRCIK